MYLDATPSPETNDFIMILRQFISRRGPPKEIWFDRGTNFVGANRELRESIARWNGSLLEEVDTRIFADSSEKIKVGQVKEKCADWRPGTYSRG